MKVTKSYIKRIIKEELTKVLSEQEGFMGVPKERIDFYNSDQFQAKNLDDAQIKQAVTDSVSMANSKEKGSGFKLADSITYYARAYARTRDAKNLQMLGQTADSYGVPAKIPYQAAMAIALKFDEANKGVNRSNVSDEENLNQIDQHVAKFI